jgi:hypothetical protein
MFMAGPRSDCRNVDRQIFLPYGWPIRLSDAIQKTDFVNQSWKSGSMRIVLLTVALAAATPLPALSQTTTQIAAHRDWSVYVHDASDGKVCFAATAPKDSTPRDVNRGPVYLYVTNWEKDGIKNEISVKIGYPFQEDSTPTVSVGDTTFQMFVREDNAFLRDPEDERRLVAAMKAGATMSVRGTSARGTVTTDNFSLFGVTAAIDEADSACR